MTDKTNAAQPTQRFITIEPIGEPPRVVPLNATEQRRAHRGPRSCEELGICQGRYPACGRCDDDYSAEADTLTPMEQIGGWFAIAFVGICTVVTLAGGASYIYFRWIAP